MKKTLLLTMLVMAVSAVSFAAPQGEKISSVLYKDANGVYHYVPSKAAQTMMKAEDITKDGLWIVPNPGSIKFTPKPAHEVMGMTEDEYAVFLKEGQGDNADAE